jgi:ribulose 1,5-bisphosphate carboxylase large subunit-like protein
MYYRVIIFNVITQSSGMMAFDFIHAGMLGGYTNDGEEELRRILDTLHKHKHNALPALRCVMYPLVSECIAKRFGNQFMSNTSGALHGRHMGIISGVREMRQSIDQELDQEEYKVAIEKWGLKE